jgi:hypothetical protein
MMSTLLLAFLLLDTPVAAATPSPGASPSPSPAAAPSAAPRKRETIAEAAARQSPARKKTPPPAKVLTNDDLDKARDGGAAVSVLAGDGEGPVGGDTSAGEGFIEVVHTEELTWRERAKPIHERIKEALAGIEQTELRLAQLRDHLRPGDAMQPFQLQEREAEIKAETERLDQFRLNAATSRQALADLEDEARRAGVPQAWLTQP